MICPYCDRNLQKKNFYRHTDTCNGIRAANEACGALIKVEDPFANEPPKKYSSSKRD